MAKMRGIEGFMGRFEIPGLKDKSIISDWENEGIDIERGIGKGELI